MLLAAASFAAGAPSSLTLEEMYDRGKEHYYAREHSRARKLFRAVLERSETDDDLRRRAHYFLGRILKDNQSQPIRALKHFYRVYHDHPPDNLTDDALFFIAEILIRQMEQPEMALPYLKAVDVHFPEGDYHDRAVEQLRRIQEERDVRAETYSLEELPRPKIKLNFEKVDIKDFVSTYAELSGKNFMYAPDIQGSVTIVSREGVPIHDLFDVFLSVLKTRGYTATREGPIYRVQRTREALEGGVGVRADAQTGLRSRLYRLGDLPKQDLQRVLESILPSNHGIVFLDEMNRVLISTSPTHLEEVDRMLTGLKAMGLPADRKRIVRYDPRFATAERLRRRMEDFLPDFMDEEDFRVVADQRANRLYLAVSKDRVEFVRRLARRFDQDLMDRLQVKVFRLQHTDEEEVARKLREILGVLPQDYTSRHIKIVPDDRQKAVVVSADSPRAFTIVKRVIQDLDRRRVEAPNNVRVYRLEHADEQDVAATLQELVGVLPGQFPEGEIKILPDERQGAIVVSAESKRVFETVERVIGQLDRKSTRTPKKHHVYKVRNSSAGPLAEKLNFLFEDREGETIRVTADEQTNSLIVSAPESEYGEIRRIIRKLDSPKEQIMIDAFIVEASADRVRELGIEWGAEGSVEGRELRLGTQFGQGAGLPLTAAPALQGLNAGLLNQAGTRLLSTLHALARHDDFKILSTAHLVANENEEATLSVGEIVPILTDSQTTPEGAVNQSFDFENVGIDLEMIPNLSAKDAVTLDISQQIQEIEQTTTGGVVGTPTRRNRDIQTTVAVPDGLTLVLGGVIRTTSSDNKQSVPVLGDLPVLRYLFQARSKSRQRTNLLVFLRPKVLKTRQDLRDATERLKKEQNLESEADTAIHHPAAPSAGTS